MTGGRGLLLLTAAALVVASCARSGPRRTPPVLLFAGTGTSPNDVKAVKGVLASRNLAFATADSARLNGMSSSEIRDYRLLIVPGGDYLEIGKGLTPATAARVRDAVHGGVNYLGICAGALLAGNVPGNGLDLTGGVRFGFYDAVNRNVHRAAVTIAPAGAPPMEQYWEDGPQLAGWGAVVARYPDGTPAAVQGRSGAGWVVLVGTHPEAPEGWRRGLGFTTPAAAANAWAGTLVDAALRGTPLPHD